MGKKLENNLIDDILFYLKKFVVLYYIVEQYVKTIFKASIEIKKINKT